MLVIAVSACVALSIRQAAETTKTDTLNSMSVTAQISFDRTSAMKEMADTGEDATPPEASDGGDSSGNGFDRGKFDFDALSIELSLEDYMTYTEALQDGDSYYYSGSVSLNAVGDLLPYGTEESTDDSSSDDESSDSPDSPMQNGKDFMGGGMNGGGMNMSSQGDFSVTGYSSYDAMLAMFGNDGSYSISDGEMFDEESSDMSCIISDELALYNDLSVGDTVVLSNPSYEDETYTLTISGIYTNSDSSDENARFSMTDPANQIFMSYGSLSSIVEASEADGNVTENSNGEEISAVLKNTISFTYEFADIDHYDTFAKEVYDLGLSDEYTVSSSDLTAFENSLAPLETLSTTAMWFFVIVLIVGGIILVTLNIFNLRERKYEVGVLTAIGMKKSKVSLQFLTEIFIVTFIAIIIGTIIGASVSVPVTNALLENQITSSQTSQDNLNQKFGFDNNDNLGNAQNPEPNMNTDDNSGKPDRFGLEATDYVDSVSSATDIYVIMQLIGIGLFLTVISSLAALISIMRYEPLKILSDRT